MRRSRFKEALALLPGLAALFLGGCSLDVVSGLVSHDLCSEVFVSGLDSRGGNSASTGRTGRS